MRFAGAWESHMRLLRSPPNAKTQGCVGRARHQPLPLDEVVLIPMRNLFLTSQGSPDMRLRRVVDRGNLVVRTPCIAASNAPHSPDCGERRQDGMSPMRSHVTGLIRLIRPIGPRRQGSITDGGANDPKSQTHDVGRHGRGAWLGVWDPRQRDGWRSICAGGWVAARRVVRLVLGDRATSLDRRPSPSTRQGRPQPGMEIASCLAESWEPA
jgi:hypothetical protein